MPAGVKDGVRTCMHKYMAETHQFQKTNSDLKYSVCQHSDLVVVCCFF